MYNKSQRKFLLTAYVTVSLVTEVFANSEEEAIEIAEGRSLQSLCNQCANGNTYEEWSLIGELDGEPMDIKIEQ